MKITIAEASGLLDEFISTDILVVGGGLAGCMAAIESCKQKLNVLLAVEGRVGKSGCTPLAGGPGGADFMVDSRSISQILGLDGMGPKEPDLRDSPDLFKEDILLEGQYLNNQRMVDVYVSEAPRRMQNLMDLGLKIHEVRSAHGSRYPRGIIVLNRNIMATIIKNVKRRPIKLLEDTKITDLLIRDEVCVGAVGVRINHGNIVGIKAKAVIIATGGWQTAYHTGGTDDLTGDGQAMAFKVGTELVDMEFATFMDRYLVWPPIASRDNFIWDWSVRRKFVNSLGEDVLKNHTKDSDRVDSSRLISKEISEGRVGKHGGVFLRNPDKTIKDGYIWMGSLLREWNHENVSFEVTLGCHYFNGGIRVNEKTETSISGLYAAGEASGGLFGARRVASALMEATIQGAIAGENAAEYVKEANDIEPNYQQIREICEKLLAPLNRKNGVKASELRGKIREVTAKTLSLHRNGVEMRSALEKIKKMRLEDSPKLWVSGTKSRNFNKEWIECLSLDSLLICVEASIRAALMREESRGFHSRTDYPQRDDETWLKNIIIRKKGEDMELIALDIVEAKAT